MSMSDRYGPPPTFGPELEKQMAMLESWAEEERVALAQGLPSPFYPPTPSAPAGISATPSKRTRIPTAKAVEMDTAHDEEVDDSPYYSGSSAMDVDSNSGDQPYQTTPVSSGPLKHRNPRLSDKHTFFVGHPGSALPPANLPSASPSVASSTSLPESARSVPAVSPPEDRRGSARGIPRRSYVALQESSDYEDDLPPPARKVSRTLAVSLPSTLPKFPTPSVLLPLATAGPVVDPPPKRKHRKKIVDPEAAALAAGKFYNPTPDIPYGQQLELYYWDEITTSPIRFMPDLAPPPEFERLPFEPGSYQGPLSPADFRNRHEFIRNQRCIPGCDYDYSEVIKKSPVRLREHIMNCGHRKIWFGEKGETDVLARLCQLQLNAMRASDVKRAPVVLNIQPNPVPKIVPSSATITHKNPSVLALVTPFQNPPKPSEAVFHFERVMEWVSETGNEIGKFVCNFCDQTATAEGYISKSSLARDPAIGLHLRICEKIGVAQEPILRLFKAGDDLGDGALMREAEARGKGAEPRAALPKKTAPGIENVEKSKAKAKAKVDQKTGNESNGSGTTSTNGTGGKTRRALSSSASDAEASENDAPKRRGRPPTKRAPLPVVMKKKVVSKKRTRDATPVLIVPNFEVLIKNDPTLFPHITTINPLAYFPTKHRPVAIQHTNPTGHNTFSSYLFRIPVESYNILGMKIALEIGEREDRTESLFESELKRELVGVVIGESTADVDWKWKK